MALTECPDCGRNVSDAAMACPSCARPLREPAPAEVRARYKNSRGTMLVFWLLMTGFGAVLIGGYPAIGVLVALVCGIMFLGTFLDVLRGRH